MLLSQLTAISSEKDSPGASARRKDRDAWTEYPPPFPMRPKALVLLVHVPVKLLAAGSQMPPPAQPWPPPDRTSKRQAPKPYPPFMPSSQPPG